MTYRPIRFVVALGIIGITIFGSSLVFAEVRKVSRLPIVDRSIAYHGGSRYDDSQTDLEMCSGSGCYDIGVRMNNGLYRYDVTGTIRGVDRRVVSTNDGLEMWVDGRPVEIPADQVSAVRDWAMARVYFSFLPFRLNDDSVFKEDQGLETWDGRSLHRVKVTFAAGSSSDSSDEYLYWFDPKTGKLEQLAYSFEGQPGGLRFRKGVRYRRIGDILFFDQENFGVEGDQYKIDQINPEFVQTMKHVSTVELRQIKVETPE